MLVRGRAIASLFGEERIDGCKHYASLFRYFMPSGTSVEFERCMRTRRGNANGEETTS